ncbi:MAG: hypothetical protein WCA46_03770, partial [Actinocatenispora sp.]
AVSVRRAAAVRPGAGAAMVSPGDLVEVGPGCGPEFTAPDRFLVDEVFTSPVMPGRASITGRWWPPTDTHRVTLTVLLSGVRTVAPTEPAP